MSKNSDPESKTLAERICDGEQIQWQPSSDAPKSNRRAALRLLETISRTHRTNRRETREFSNGETWGPLQLLGSLGEGSFGTVYRAFDPLLQREVALKLARIEGGQARQWINEARRLSRISHPNVVAIHGAEIHDGRAGIWLERIEGQSLQQWIERQGPLGSGELIAVGEALCAALAAVHAAGLIHGDIKPANILRENGGRIVLLDFGSARDSSAGELLTGSPAYLAPELLAGGAPGVSTDIFAFGMTLKFLLTGQAPDAGSGEQSLLDLRPDLPATLIRCINSACAQNPAQRPPTVGAVARNLIATPNLSLPATRRLPFAASSAMIATACLFVAVALWGGHAWMQSRTPLLEDLGFITRDATGLTQPITGPLRMGQPLALRMTTTRPVFVYIINQDDQGHSHVLYPLATQPQAIPAGKNIELPGVVAGQPMDWQVDSASSQERFAVVVAIQRLVELERLLVDWSRAGEATGASGTTFRGVGELIRKKNDKQQDLTDLISRFAQTAGVEIYWLELPAN